MTIRFPNRYGPLQKTLDRGGMILKSKPVSTPFPSNDLFTSVLVIGEIRRGIDA